MLCTGHSLGAALTTLAAADLLLLSGLAPVSLYTFGSPRVFDSVGLGRRMGTRCVGRVRVVRARRVAADCVALAPTPMSHTQRHTNNIWHICTHARAHNKTSLTVVDSPRTLFLFGFRRRPRFLTDWT